MRVRQPVRRGRAPADHRHAEAAAAIGVALGHRDRIVLVSRAVEALDLAAHPALAKKLAAIMAKQMPDAEKLSLEARARAHALRFDRERVFDLLLPPGRHLAA